jgi:crotonobetainyl-CoA:carnitine CoA-transferase CaiB-like acyl-CoA transferase
VRMTTPTPRLGESPAVIHSTGPALGAHNREVYESLGLDEAELHALTRDGII